MGATQALYRGVKTKLTPARRAFFVLCLILALVGADKEQDGPWHLVAFAGIVFLLLVELADRTQARDELEVARQLQRDLLPTEAPPLPGYEFAFSYRAANTIGGDYYHFVPLPDGRIVVLIGDASGHGMAAGLLMAIADTTIHIGLESDPSPLAVTELLNAALIRTGGTRAFMTLFVGLLEPRLRCSDLRFGGSSLPAAAPGRRDGACVSARARFPSVSAKRSTSSPRPWRSRPEISWCSTRTVSPRRSTRTARASAMSACSSKSSQEASAEEVHDRVLNELSRFEGDQSPMDDRSLVVVRQVR